MNRTPMRRSTCGCASTLAHRRDCPRYKEPKALNRRERKLSRNGMKACVSCGGVGQHRRECLKFVGPTRQQSPTLQRKRQIRRHSKKREVENRRYTAWRRELLLERSACEYPGDHQCIGRIDLHHIWTLGQGGPRMDPQNVAVCCRLKHSYAHDHPLEAAELGMLGRDAYVARALEATV